MAGTVPAATMLANSYLVRGEDGCGLDGAC